MAELPPGQSKPVPVPAPRKAGRLSYVMAGEIVPDFWSPGLVDGILETKAMTIVYGPSGAGKTAVVVDLACRIAAGMKWRGRETQQGLVLYVAAENAESTGRRVWAWMQQHKVGSLPLALVKSPVTLGDDALKEIIGLAAQVEHETGEKVRLIVFDTLARTMAGDENVAKDMGVYVKALDTLKEVTGGHVLVVHHTGKDEGRGARGSSALKAATDHELEVSKEKGSRVGAVTLTKVREGDLEGQRYGYEMTPRILGTNRLGRTVTTVVVSEAEAPEKSATKGGEDAERITDFIDALAEPISEKELRKRLKLRDEAGANRQAWYTAKKRGAYELDARGLVVL